jgi:hypothetical protein
VETIIAVTTKVWTYCKPEVVMGGDELLRHQRADCDAARVHEFQHHGLAAEL